ncbi:hypothetical protein GH714_023092 [Hevea brasiliensis]|uniref:Phytocyanin domain-containing protein n=1 Tax=Hevea brasiliensis TaxID=3981 RepID=A0A6A6LK08_HEVBR|nr:hypothetical protein GH714_023092 [Hevea brasiliensis]
MASFIGVAFGFVVVVLLQCAAAQTVHVVGDNSGWTILQGGAQAYTEWANGKNFVVGDILTFNFETNKHDVLRVQKTSFDACSSSNPIGDVITTGPVNFTLDSAGDHYYICTFSQHCQLGQKLAITVSSSGGTPGASPPPSTTPRLSPPPTSPSPTNTPAICPPDAPAVVVLLQCAAAQTVHVVGDNSGWTILQGGAQAYTEWANGKNFVIGDILTFNFETNKHDVLRVQRHPSMHALLQILSET